MAPAVPTLAESYTGPSPKSAERAGNNRPFTRTTPLGAIIKGTPAKWSHISASLVYNLRKSDLNLYAFVLNACTVEQTKFLACIWADEFFLDDEMLMTFATLVKTGRLLDVLDVTSEAARERVILVNTGILVGLGKL